MFGKRSFASKDRAGKATKVNRRSFALGGDKKAKLLERQLSSRGTLEKSITQPQQTSAIVTLVVGADQRLFAAHEDVLSRSPYFARALKDLFFSNPPTNPGKRLDLTTEEPETFSLVLEYLYKGDYTPRLLSDKHGHRLENGALPGSPSSVGSPKSPGVVPPTMYHNAAGGLILRDTAVYCAAEAYGLDELKRLALRKQGLQVGIEVAVILRSMRFAYSHTPDTDSRLRAHYLALVVRSRKTFKRSGTMQMEMAKGGAMFFDLFVAMCNHLDDVSLAAGNSPRTI